MDARLTSDQYANLRTLQAALYEADWIATSETTPDRIDTAYRVKLDDRTTLRFLANALDTALDTEAMGGTNDEPATLNVPAPVPFDGQIPGRNYREFAAWWNATTATGQCDLWTRLDRLMREDTAAHDAAHLTAEGSSAADPEDPIQHAYRWNGWSTPKRRDYLKHVRDVEDTAATCFEMNHTGAVHAAVHCHEQHTNTKPTPEDHGIAIGRGGLQNFLHDARARGHRDLTVTASGGGEGRPDTSTFTTITLLDSALTDAQFWSRDGASRPCDHDTVDLNTDALPQPLDAPTDPDPYAIDLRGPHGTIHNADRATQGGLDNLDPRTRGIFTSLLQQTLTDLDRNTIRGILNHPEGNW